MTEAEMEAKSSWLWKRKTSDSLHSAVDCKQDTKQAITEAKEQVQVSNVIDNGAETKFQILSEQLMVRDELVQQHANVAEEAILGWQKAEREAARLRQQLEKEIIDKVSLESQVVELNETMKNFRTQLQRAQHTELSFREAVAAKTQNLEELHTELQTTISKVSSESLRAAKELDARIRAEARVNVLQATVEVAEREQVKLKHQLYAVTEKLEKRNEEWKLSKMATEKQHREDSKRISALEHECQQLRRRIQAGLWDPPAIAQMRKELQDLSLFGKGSRVSYSTEFRIDSSTACSDSKSEGHPLLPLRKDEALMKKDVQPAKRRSTGANMLSAAAAREQLGHPYGVLHRHTRSVTEGYYRSLADPHSFRDEEFDDESISAESWASALISELAQLKKREKGEAAERHMTSGSDLLEDFEEMEKIASLPYIHGEPEPAIVNQQESQSCNMLEDHGHETAKEVNGSSISDICSELSMNLVRTQDELNACKLENVEMKANLSSIERHLLMMLQEASQKNHMFDKIGAALEIIRSCRQPAQPSSLGTESPEVRDIRAWSPSGQSSQSDEDQLQPGYYRDPTQELFHAVHKVVCLFERLPGLLVDSNDSYASHHGLRFTVSQQRNSEFHACIRKVIVLCEGFLNGKVDLHTFLVETATALQWVVKHMLSLPEKSPEAANGGTAVRQLEFGTYYNSTSHNAATGPLLMSKDSKPHLQHDMQEQAESSTHLQNQNVAEHHRLPRAEFKEYIDTRLAMLTTEIETLKCILRSSEAASRGMHNSPMQAHQKSEENRKEESASHDSGSSEIITAEEEHDADAELRPRHLLEAEPALQTTQTVACCEPLVVGVGTIGQIVSTPAVSLTKERADVPTENLHKNPHSSILCLAEELQSPGMPISARTMTEQRDAHVTERRLNTDRSSEPSSQSFSHLSPENLLLSPMPSFSAPSSPTALEFLIKSPSRFLKMKPETNSSLSFDKHASKLSRFFSRRHGDA